MEFRLLKADEIDVRVAQVKESGCSLLLYKDARVDMNILDTTIERSGRLGLRLRMLRKCVKSI